MSVRESIERTILNAVQPVTISSSTNATPSVVTTSGAHGILAGQRVFIQGHATNTAINGIFLAKAVTSTTITLGDEISNADVAANGVGGATGFCMLAPIVEHSGSFKSVTFELDTSGTTTAVISAAISNGKQLADASSPRWEYPNFGATISKTNPYSFAALRKLSTDAVTSGVVGVTLAGADVNDIYEAQGVNGVKYFTVFPTSWTQGVITVKAKFLYF